MSVSDPFKASAKPSSAPLWIGGIVGALFGELLIGHGNDAFGLVAGAVLGTLVGVAIRVSRAADRAFDRDSRLEQLESRVAGLAREIEKLKGATQPAPIVPPTPAPASLPPAPIEIEIPPLDRPAPKPAAGAQPAPLQRPLQAAMQSTAQPTAQPGAGAGAALQWSAAVRDWLLGGNTVARVGLLILFVGVAFLLRYVAERTRIPIEVRLVGVAVGALLFLAIGWRLRTGRPGFAMTMQGGAIAILYMTAFASLRVYGVLPAAAAFVFMALLAILSGLLAILQDGRALAGLGALGGFAAPLLISTGSGRVEVLFAFYLLLDLGVLGVAWFRAWRELNWIAFVFTFTVSGLWSVQRYVPADFAMAQSFLAAFWILFVSVAMLHALRQPSTRRGRFDTTLVFALPLVVLGIQSRFTHGLPLAFASLIASAVYLSASMVLLHRGEAALKLLVEANFGLGVAFLTLAVPLAASAQWTAAAWALEGVATAWVGLRQQRALPLLAGMALQGLAALALAQAIVDHQVSLAPQWSGVTLNLAVLAAAALAIASLLQSRSAADWVAPGHLSRAWLAWMMRLIGWLWAGVLLWQPLEYSTYIYAWSLLALALAVADRSADSGEADLTAEWVASVGWIVASMVAAFAMAPAHLEHPAAAILARLMVAAVALAASLLSLGRDWRRRTAAGLLLSLAVFGWLFAVLAEAVVRGEPALAVAQLALVLAAFSALALGWLSARLHWAWPQRLAWSFHAGHLVFATYVISQAILSSEPPSDLYGGAAWVVAWLVYYARFFQASRSNVELPQVAVAGLHVAGLWTLPAMVAAECTARLIGVVGSGWVHASWGALAAAALWFAAMRPPRWPASTAPAAYSGVGATGLAFFGAWWLLVAGIGTDGDPSPLPALALLNPMDVASLLVLVALIHWRQAGRSRVLADAVLLGSAFLVANLLLLRTLHFTANVAWSIEQWSRSLLVQASLSILWTVLAMIVMVVAHRRAWRPMWLVGAALLGAVIVKMLAIDLSGRGTVERIVSFVAVGLLIILIGYLSPVPPVRAAAPASPRTGRPEVESNP
jgi:uncharacterized membrane protein